MHHLGSSISLHIHVCLLNPRGRVNSVMNYEGVRLLSLIFLSSLDFPSFFVMFFQVSARLFSIS